MFFNKKAPQYVIILIFYFLSIKGKKLYTSIDESSTNLIFFLSKFYYYYV